MASIQVGYGTVDLTGAYWPLESVQTSSATGAQHNFALNTSTHILLLSGAAPVLSGMTGGRTGRTVIVYFNGATSCTLQHQNIGSIAANEFYTQQTADLVFAPNSWVLLGYFNSRWIVMTHPHAQRAEIISGAWTFSSTLGVTGALTAGSITTAGSISMADQVLTRAAIKDYSEAYSSPTISGGVLTLNYENGNVFVVQVTANINTITFSNWAPNGLKGSVEVWFGGNGTAYTHAAFNAIRWPNDIAPTLTSTSGDYTLVVFHSFDAAANVFGSVAASGW